jgi:uncharacterized cupin superfamily protein
MAGQIINWDDVPRRAVQRGPLDAVWTNLGAASGTVRVGLRREEMQPGRRALPPHAHTAEEELFFVVGGSGLSWQGGEVYEVRAGDCLLHLPAGKAHALIAGPDGLDVLAFGDRVPTEAAYLPRGHVAWLGPTWVSAGDGEHPWARDAAAGELELPQPSPRPPTMVNVEDVQPERTAHGEADFVQRKLSLAVGSRHAGLRHVTVAPGKCSFPPHCHSMDEELFVVLDGDGVALLQSPLTWDWKSEEHPVRRGSVVALPAGTGMAHAFRAGADGVVYLAYGTNEPGDVVWYPRSHKIGFGGLGIRGRLEPLDYWDGEE